MIDGADIDKTADAKAIEQDKLNTPKVYLIEELEKVQKQRIAEAANFEDFMDNEKQKDVEEMSTEELEKEIVKLARKLYLNADGDALYLKLGDTINDNWFFSRHHNLFALIAFDKVDEKGIRISIPFDKEGGYHVGVALDGVDVKDWSEVFASAGSDPKFHWFEPEWLDPSKSRPFKSKLEKQLRTVLISFYKDLLAEQELQSEEAANFENPDGTETDDTEASPETAQPEVIRELRAKYPNVVVVPGEEEYPGWVSGENFIVIRNFDGTIFAFRYDEKERRFIEVLPLSSGWKTPSSRGSFEVQEYRKGEFVRNIKGISKYREKKEK